jgi:hypothetical protein
MTYDETKAAVVELLARFGKEPRILYDIGIPLVARGFDQNLIVNALFDLAHDGAVEMLSGNRVRALKLPVAGGLYQ